MAGMIRTDGATVAATLLLDGSAEKGRPSACASTSDPQDRS